MDDLVDKLKSKHGVTYTIIQYRVWAETMEAGRHDNLDSPPKGSFFKSQGRKCGPSTSTASPGKGSNPGLAPEQLALTPSKTAQLRTTYIQQIKDLHCLLEMGAITNDHFVKQRDTLLEQMNKLTSD